MAKNFKIIRKFKKSHKRHIFGKTRKRRKITKIKRIIAKNTPHNAPKTPEHSKTPGKNRERTEKTTRALKNTGKKPGEYRKTPGFPHPACGNVENFAAHSSFYEVHLSFLRRFLPEKVRSFQKFGDFGADYASFIYEALILSQQRHIQASPCRKGHDSKSALRSSEPRLYGRFSISERGKACPRNTFSALRRPDLSE